MSPYSLTSALVMLLPGTDGNSRLQLVKALFDPQCTKTDDADKHVGTYAEINKNTIVKNEAMLKVANLLYSHKRYRKVVFLYDFDSSFTFVCL